MGWHIKIKADKKENEKAIEAAKTANRISESVYSYHNLGNAYKALNRIEDAKEAYLSGYYLDSKCSFILKTLGVIHEEQKDYVSAEKYYKEFLVQEPENEDIQERLDKIRSIIR